MPEPVVATVFKRSHGIAVGSGDGLLATISPLTELPSCDRQVGPAPWVATAFPEAPVRMASGA